MGKYRILGIADGTFFDTRGIHLVLNAEQLESKKRLGSLGMFWPI